MVLGEVDDNLVVGHHVAEDINDEVVSPERGVGCHLPQVGTDAVEAFTHVTTLEAIEPFNMGAKRLLVVVDVLKDVQDDDAANVVTGEFIW